MIFRKLSRFSQSCSSRHLAVLGQRRVLHQFVVIARRQRAASRRSRRRRAHPVEHRHPLIAPDRDAQRAHIGDQVDHVLDLFVLARQPQLDLVHGRPALDHGQLETAVLIRRLHARQWHVAPRQIILRSGRLHQPKVHRAYNMCNATLLHHLPQRRRIRAATPRQSESFCVSFLFLQVGSAARIRAQPAAGARPSPRRLPASIGAGQHDCRLCF